MIAASKDSMAFVCTTILLFLTSVQGERVWYNDGGSHQVRSQVYDSHNIFIVNGTNATLENVGIKAPSSGDDGEDAVRVEDATLHAKSGIISGGLGVGGTGVTISTTRDSEHPPGSAIFEAGVQVYGGDATREKTTKGGDAVQILQSGSVATFNGGKFVPGTGCTMRVCGTTTADGVAVQVVQGKAIIKGGTFEGVVYNVGGDVEVHGCVEYNKDTEKITGVLLDGSNIDVVYGPEGQHKPDIVYQSEVCPEEEPESLPSPAGPGKTVTPLTWVGSCSILMVGFIITFQ